MPKQALPDSVRKSLGFNNKRSASKRFGDDDNIQIAPEVHSSKGGMEAKAYLKMKSGVAMSERTSGLVKMRNGMAAGSAGAKDGHMQQLQRQQKQNNNDQQLAVVRRQMKRESSSGAVVTSTEQNNNNNQQLAVVRRQMKRESSSGAAVPSTGQNNNNNQQLAVVRRQMKRESSSGVAVKSTEMGFGEVTYDHAQDGRQRPKYSLNRGQQPPVNEGGWR